MAGLEEELKCPCPEGKCIYYHPRILYIPEDAEIILDLCQSSDPREYSQLGELDGQLYNLCRKSLRDC
ncbi:MAG: hypothetical protein PHF86_06045 [Candidatus Nanoarchaeia archaeon]|nr:hypothetical protein [Candidatus Nanoarchaeia archaeon]